MVASGPRIVRRDVISYAFPMAAIFSHTATPFHGVSMIATSTEACAKNGR